MLEIKLENNKQLIVTTDNAGSIGKKELDHVKIDYESLAYYTLRNALMENLRFHTKIIGITISNFCGEKNYHDLMKGIEELTKHFNYDIPITTSTESNFPMKESAIGITVLGIKDTETLKHYANYAVVGKPLVGNEVSKAKSEMVQFDEFLYLVKHQDISRVITVGSKGIYDRGMKHFNQSFESSEIDLFKSAGPSTCVLIEYRTLKDIKKSILNKTYTLKTA